MYIEEVGEFDWDRAYPVSAVSCCDIRYLLFYNRDGAGTPYGWCSRAPEARDLAARGQPRRRGHLQALLDEPGLPAEARAGRPLQRHQHRRAIHRQPVTGWTRWTLYPELAAGAGGEGETLLDALRRQTVEKHLGWWRGATCQPTVELTLRWWPAASRRRRCGGNSSQKLVARSSEFE